MITHKNKKQWLEALRSGDYTKCKKQYFSRDFAEADALGVLVLTTQDNPIEEEPAVILRKLGLTHDERSKITSMNDDPADISFEDIADWIEENVQSY